MKNRLIAFLFLIICLVCGCWPSINRNDYKKYKPLVEKIRGMNLSPAKELIFRLDNLNDFASLRKLKEGEVFGRGQGVGLVWVRISDNNKIIIVIEIIDNGHAGEAGFVYTESPLKTRDYGDGWLMAEIPGRLWLTTSERKINENWWEVIYNLD